MPPTLFCVQALPSTALALDVAAEVIVTGSVREAEDTPVHYANVVLPSGDVNRLSRGRLSVRRGGTVIFERRLTRLPSRIVVVVYGWPAGGKVTALRIGERDLLGE